MNQFANCPKCQQNNAQQLSFTWWGGVIGPKLLTHVKCQNCGAKYNGKTGNSNTMAIAIYSVVVLVVVFFLFFILRQIF
jgi:transcription elongation factor Elf1